MPINVNSLYLDVNDLVNSSQEGLLDADRFTRYANAASRDLFDDLNGYRGQYQYGSPVSRTGGFSRNLKIVSALHPFLKSVVVQVQPNGYLVRPSDFAEWGDATLRYDRGALFECMCNESKAQTDCPEFAADPTQKSLSEKVKIELAKVYPEAEIDFVDWNEVSERLNSAIYKPTPKHPLCYPFATDGATPELNVLYFQIIPKDVGSIFLKYLRLPKDCKYSTVDDAVYNQPVYDPSTSINLEWSTANQNELAERIRDYFSWFTKDPETLQKALQEKELKR